MTRVNGESSPQQKASERLCLALDSSDRAEILASAKRFGSRVGWLKVGLEAFVS